MTLTVAIALFVVAALVGSYGTIIGAGGGFVLIPAFVLLFDLEGVEAVGTGAATLAVIGATGAFSYDRQGLVDRPVAGWFALATLPAALFAGWQLANRIDATVLVASIGVFLLLLAVFVLVVRVVEGGEPRPPQRLRLMGAGALLGTLSGTFAVGSGLLSVTLLGRLQRLGPHRAAATTSATAMATSVAGATGHAIAGNVVWSMAVVAMAGALVGSTLGARLAGRLSERTMLMLLAGGLVAAGVPLLIRAF